MNKSLISGGCSSDDHVYSHKAARSALRQAAAVTR